MCRYLIEKNVVSLLLTLKALYIQKRHYRYIWAAGKRTVGNYRQHYVTLTVDLKQGDKARSTFRFKDNRFAALSSSSSNVFII